MVPIARYTAALDTGFEVGRPSTIYDTGYTSDKPSRGFALVALPQFLSAVKPCRSASTESHSSLYVLVMLVLTV